MINFQLILSLAIIAIVVASLLAPLESLTWWAGWLGDEDDLDEIPVEASTQENTAKRSRAFLVYLTGIGSYSEQTFPPEEQDLLEQLEQTFKDVVIVNDIYSYSVRNSNLIDNGFLARFWRFAAEQQEKNAPLGLFINARNVLQVLVAADSRYGPMYAHGIARVVIKSLKRHGYPLDSGVPIYFVGYSGGGEMSISAAGPVKQSLKAPVTVISLGGVVSDDPNIEDVEALYHLYGKKDNVQRIGAIIFPGRWRILWLSRWNKARRSGKIHFISMGDDVIHTKAGGYLDKNSYFVDGQSYLDKTVQTIAKIIAQKSL